MTNGKRLVGLLCAAIAFGCQRSADESRRRQHRPEPAARPTTAPTGVTRLVEPSSESADWAARVDTAATKPLASLPEPSEAPTTQPGVASAYGAERFRLVNQPDEIVAV